MANLIYCATERSMEAWSADLHKRGLEEPFMMKGAGDIPEAIEALKSDRDVVAHARPATVTGWRAPVGTVVVLDEDMNASDHPDRRAMSDQARMRAPVSTPQLRPHQERMMREIQKMDPDELSERLGQIGIHLQSQSRLHRVNQPPIQAHVVSLDSILSQMDSKRDAWDIGQVVPTHDLLEGLHLVNAANTTGKLVIARDRFDAHAATKKDPGAVNFDEPSKTESALEALRQGGVVVTTTGIIGFGLARKTACQIQLTEMAMQDAGVARAAIRVCRERLGSPLVTFEHTLGMD
ncbi:hypothetical protein KUV57_12445 [Epibacterium sp. DP7N7-1]|nr:hypothetical protein [Epibacterium sp. DP7N7-1]